MRVYLDYNATTPIDPRVREEMNALFAEGALNPGSQHAHGRRARSLFEEAQARVLKTLELEKNHRVVFCGSSTEAINLAVRGSLAGVDQPKVALSSIEHPAVAQTVEDVAKTLPVLASRDGTLDVDGLGRQLEQANLAAFMYANNETGGLLPVNEIAATCRGAGVPLLLDCCQAPGKCEFDVREARPDMLVVSGHKMYGPAGIAALVIRKDLALKREITGGGQQYGMRAGTEPVVLACGLAKALELALAEPNLDRSHGQGEKLFAAIRDVAPNAILTIPDAERRLANTLHYRIPGLTSERQVIYSDQESKEGVRISVGRFTTDKEIDFACAAIQQVLSHLLAKTPQATAR
ncbi:MAG: aminotransferase class V-fold PLP-dependent enzyme [Planctomycetes bacterium]|nr:aminotransferase class V-fold PLP-dependent enzyme [Planctomycetota bacterium]